MASTQADFRELRANSGATVQELQEFLRELRGKSPQEMLGIVASSQLIRATIISLILVTGTLFALTAIPYFFGNSPSPAAAVASPTLPSPPPDPEPASPPEVTPPTDPIAPLGVNEKLPAPANANPLEDSNEDFLKDLE